MLKKKKTRRQSNQCTSALVGSEGNLLNHRATGIMIVMHCLPVRVATKKVAPSKEIPWYQELVTCLVKKAAIFLLIFIVESWNTSRSPPHTVNAAQPQTHQKSYSKSTTPTIFWTPSRSSHRYNPDAPKKLQETRPTVFVLKEKDIPIPSYERAFTHTHTHTVHVRKCQANTKAIIRGDLGGGREGGKPTNM